MKFNATYNFLILLFLYAFCCTCVRGIETSFDVNLHMLVMFRHVWTAAVTTCLLPLLVIFWLHKDRTYINELQASNGLVISTNILNTVWLTSLFVVVTGNLSTANSFLVGNLSAEPFLLGLMVNIFAVVAYCTNYFTIEKHSNLPLYKTIVLLSLILLSAVSVIIAQVSLPVQYLRAVYKDGVKHDALCYLERDIRHNSAWTLSPSSWSNPSYLREEVVDIIKKGDIKISMVDDTHVKMEWKRSIEPEVLEKSGRKKALLRSYQSYYYDWGMYYEKTEKTIEMEEKIADIRKKQKEKKESSDCKEPDDTSNKSNDSTQSQKTQSSETR